MVYSRLIAVFRRWFIYWIARFQDIQTELDLYLSRQSSLPFSSWNAGSNAGAITRLTHGQSWTCLTRMCDLRMRNRGFSWPPKPVYMVAWKSSTGTLFPYSFGLSQIRNSAPAKTKIFLGKITNTLKTLSCITPQGEWICSILFWMKFNQWGHRKKLHKTETWDGVGNRNRKRKEERELDGAYFQSLTDFWLKMGIEFSNIPSPTAIKIKEIFFKV